MVPAPATVPVPEPATRPVPAPPPAAPPPPGPEPAGPPRGGTPPPGYRIAHTPPERVGPHIGASGGQDPARAACRRSGTERWRRAPACRRPTGSALTLRRSHGRSRNPGSTVGCPPPRRTRCRRRHRLRRLRLQRPRRSRQPPHRRRPSHRRRPPHRLPRPRLRPRPGRGSSPCPTPLGGAPRASAAGLQ